MEEEKIFRKDLLEILGIKKRQWQALQKKHKAPSPDFPAQVGHPGHGGKGHGYIVKTLLPSLSKSQQEKVLAFLQKKTTTESQALVCIPPGPVALIPEDCPSLPTVQYDAETINIPRAHEHTEKERRRFAEKREVLSVLQGGDSIKEKERLISLWKANNPDVRCSFRSAERWEKDYREFGPEGLYSDYTRGNCSTVTKEQDAAFKKIYLTQQRPSAQICRDLLEGQYPEIPSAKAFMRRLTKETPKEVIYLKRYGPKAHNRKFAPYIERDYSTVQPGQIYVMDHCQIDVDIIGPDGKPMFPWATGCADVASRKILAFFLGGPPNAATIILTFCRASLRFGLPRELLIDNGKDFRSRVFSGGVKRFRMEMDVEQTKSLLFQVGVVPKFALPYSPQTKPIERFFLTRKERFSRLFPTFRGGNVQERPEELQAIIKSGRVPSLDEFEKIHAEWIEAVFNNSPHRGAGMEGRTPNEVWGVNNVARMVDENLLSLLLLKSSRPLKVGRNGVRHLDRWYFAEPLLHIKGEDVYLRYDPGEMGRVWVYSMADAFICQARERDRIPWGASEEILSQAMKEKRREIKAIQAYHKISDDRSREPDLLKAFIAKKAREHSTDLSSDTLYPEKPLLRPFRERVAQKDEEEIRQQRERSAELSTRLMADADEEEKARQEKEKIRREFTQDFLREEFPDMWGGNDGGIK